MREIRFIKACPFLRDLGDSYLCINQDDVVDVQLDPLIDIEWSEDLLPVASEVDDIETCLFILERKKDDRLFCVSRKMFLSMDKRDILWADIRDAIILLQLDGDISYNDSQIDFCSTCLYKVLLASSPAFQKKIDTREKIRLGTSYIINRANEIYKSLRQLSLEINKQLIDDVHDAQTRETSNFETSAFNWMLWLTQHVNLDDEFNANTINWVQKFDEWSVMVSKVADSETEEEKIRLIEQSYVNAAKLKEISFDLVLRASYVDDKDELLINAEKVFSRSTIFFEDYMFISKQFLDIIKRVND